MLDVSSRLVGGGFVVTWTSSGQDGSSNGVYGQVFNSAGSKVDGEFRVNTYTANSQQTPSVVSLWGGGFVATWTSSGQDGSSLGVYAQVFSSAGTKVGSEFRVNTYTTGDQVNAAVAALSGGGFVVTWASDLPGGSLGYTGQIFDSAGAKVGGEFRVNTSNTSGFQTTSVIGVTGGGFVVTWDAYTQVGSTWNWNVYGQVFDSTGKKLGNEVRVNTYTSSDQFGNSLANLSGGSFVVTWVSYGQDGSSEGIYGQIFSLIVKPPNTEWSWTLVELMVSGVLNMGNLNPGPS